MRYFFISYNYRDKDGSDGCGNFVYNSESFPNKIYIENKIKKIFKHDCDIVSVVIFNIMELSEYDYYDYSKE